MEENQENAKLASLHLLSATLWQLIISKQRRQERQRQRQNAQRYREIIESHCRRIANFRRHQSHLRAGLLFVIFGAHVSNSSSERSVWSFPRDKQFWEFIVQRTFTPTDWLENFRMSQSTFQFVCSKLDPIIRKQNTLFRKCIPAEQRVAMTIWCLATGSDYRHISSLFGVSKAALCNIIKQVCKAIIEVFWADYVTVPQKSEEVETIMAAFHQKYHLPNCCGLLSTMHVPIVTPHGCDTRYCNSGGWYSIVLQLLSDDKGIIMDATADFPGGTIPWDVLTNSTLHSEAQSGKLFPNCVKTNEEIPNLIIGENVYNPLPWLLVPFGSENLNPTREVYNNQLLKSREIFDDVTSHLRGRWQCLQKKAALKTEDVPNIIKACCVLHNICERRSELFDSSWIESPMIPIPPINLNQPQLDDQSLKIRDMGLHILIV